MLRQGDKNEKAATECWSGCFHRLDFIMGNNTHLGFDPSSGLTHVLNDLSFAALEVMGEQSLTLGQLKIGMSELLGLNSDEINIELLRKVLNELQVSGLSSREFVSTVQD